ncbi:hypothetical protein BGZ46_007189 [Entomortierella lignicola]|nr:hypothetical protein BGZ46_007189 [Entomortierella lignicola]
MNQLTSQLEQVQIQDNASPSTEGIRSLEEITKADTLIRTLYSYLENKTQSSSTGRKRTLVSASSYELDLEKERKSSTKKNLATKNNSINKITITSWKMNEFEYVKGTLPTLARGLFTYKDPSQKKLVTSTKETSQQDSQSNDDDDGIYQILIRGYDKFFNVGEVKKTQPAFIANQTEGPYEVTLKENGCIIFMSGLPPHLVGPQGGCIVSSKHSLGYLEAKDDQPEVSHSAKGREWLEKSLASKGKTLQEFGLWLWNNNLTAVAELCDDTFEEHVLQYSAEKAGLYLHGLNRNTADFQTLSSDKVQEAAKEWGLIRTDYVTFNTHQEVMDFAEKVRNAGEYDNRAVEGFVVRCKTKEDGNVFFFKIKYDEPYLMYREWRELTKSLWALEVKKNAGKIAQSAEPKKSRMKYPLTKYYVEYVQQLMKERPELFIAYNKNQGIIAIRDMFVKYWESKSPQSQDSLLAASPDLAKPDAVTEEGFQRTVLIPIATIGCGKTTVAVALSKLFGWKHVSSDDFYHFKKTSSQKFIKEVVNQLQNNTVVIADRNNFQYSHRERVINAIRAAYPKTRFVALYWSHDDLPIARIREILTERVKSRGSNHQCMTPEYCPEYEHIIHTFLRSFDPLNPVVEPDSNFSYVVESRPGEDSLEIVKRVIEEFAIPTLGAGGIGNHSIPSPDEVKEAVRFAREDWQPERVATGEAAKYHLKKTASQQSLVDSSSPSASEATSSTAVGSRKQRKVKEPKYFAIALDTGSVLAFLDSLFDGSSKSKTAPEWTQLEETLKTWKENNRIGIHQHVTLIHTSARKDLSPKKAQRAEDLWKSYTDEVAKAERPSLTEASTSATSATSSQTPAEDEFTKVIKKSERGKATRSASLSPSFNDLQSTISVDYIIWSERIMALRVVSAKRAKTGQHYESTNSSLHVTVGTVGDQVKPFESNELLRQWSTKTKHGTSESTSPGGVNIYSVKLDKPKVFNGELRAMMY